MESSDAWANDAWSELLAAATAPDFWAEQLYDGAGTHHANLFPPLMVGNELTDAYRHQKGLRPACCKLAVSPEAEECLGLVWMAPLDLSPAGPFQPEVVARLVTALDAGQMVLVHADRQDTADCIATVVSLFVGGGHA